MPIGWASVKEEFTTDFHAGGTCAMILGMGTRKLALGAAGFALLLALNALAADVGHGSNRVQVAAVPATPIRLAAFRLAPGFRIELAAAEPMVSAPVALAFDENGRLFVAELPASPTGAQRPAQGRIRLLEAPDKNGVYQKSTIFASDLSMPSAVACYAGGVFVGLTPEVQFLKSTKTEGIAEVKKVVLAGFGGTNAPSQRALLNNFNWGLQNRIYGATAGLGGVVISPNWPGNPISVGGCDFSFNPRTLAVVPEAGPAQSGLAFNNFGRLFGCDFSRPLRVAMCEPRYLGRNPFFPRAPWMIDAASPATALFGLLALPQQTGLSSPTRLTEVGGARQVSVQGAAWLTGARGCVVCRGNIFPPGYQGSVFVAVPDSHAIHRFVVHQDGLSISAQRPPEEPSSEFLVCSDPSFRPEQIVNGPDGALYVADRQDRSDHGRIYRIVPENFRRPALPQLGKASTYELVSDLAHADGWHRDTAARLLFERGDPAAIPLLTNMADHARLSLARLQALHTLSGLDALRQTQELRALSDPDPLLREHGVRLAEKLLTNGIPSDELWNALKPLATDPSIRVRYQLALTLGAVGLSEKPSILAQILKQDLANPWIQTAVLSSLAEGSAALFELLASDARFIRDPQGFEFLQQLACMIGTQGNKNEVAQVVNFITKARLERIVSYTALFKLGEGLHRTQSSLGLVDAQGLLQPFFFQALSDGTDANLSEPVRVAAVRLVSVSTLRFDETGDWLLLLCNPQPFPDLQQAAIDALGRYEDPRVLAGLLNSWSALTPSLRIRAVSALLSHTSRVAGVLAAIEAGKIAPTDLSWALINFLRTLPDPALSRRAVQLLGPVPLRRPEVAQRLQGALRLSGIADNGRSIFQARCAQCHQIAGNRQLPGPDLAGARTLSKAELLRNIIEPSANLAAGFQTVVVTTLEGESRVGVLADDNEVTLTLNEPGGARQVWPKLNVLSVVMQPWSLMPNGLGQGLSVQDMADLLSYLETAQP